MMRKFVLLCFILIHYGHSMVDLDIFMSIKFEEISENWNVFDSYKHLTDLEHYPDVCSDHSNEECASKWLEEINKVSIRNINRMANVEFDYSTNMNQQTLALIEKFQLQGLKLSKKFEAKVKKFQWKSFQSEQIRNKFKKLSFFLNSNNETISQELIDIGNKISLIYNNGKACSEFCLKPGESDIVNLFQRERDYDTLAGFWTAWRDATGAKMRNLFIEKIKLENLGARENGYDNVASATLEDDFEEKHFEKSIFKLYDSISPLYKELHAYVRYCLLKQYPGRFRKNGPIPAHIFGNVWAQQWNNIYPLIQNCMGYVEEDNFQNEATATLSDFSVRKMFQMAEDFYVSIGMYKMTPKFWERSMLTEPSDKLVDCHGSAHDFSNGEDFRIKMCTEKNLNDFTTIHHEMGHIQYYMAYRNLPLIYRYSANSGFHEAIGDSIALAVKTPDHLKRIGLISGVPKNEEFDLQYLMATALEKVVFLPFALTMDSYMWGVYNGSVSFSNLNKHWWDLRYRYQGIKPPVARSEHDFDPGAKYHIAFGISYIRYFVSFIIQFQFYESMCKESGYQGPLHRCDFYKSKEAGSLLLKMLKKGRSEHWKKTMKILTGQEYINPNSLLNFFEPLHKWLTDENKRLKIHVGW